MPEFILIMHNDAPRKPAPEMWPNYFSALRAARAFEGGSSIGLGQTYRKEGIPAPTADHLTGYLRVHAAGLSEAAQCLVGNPVYECGGTVEIRQLLRD